MKLPVSNAAELERWVQGFADGHFECLILVSWPGTGKTTILEKAVKDKAHILKGGQISAFQFYIELYENRDRLIVVDDIDSLLGDRETVNLLKCVANTDPVKIVGWHTSTSKLGDIPREFSTTSKIAITTNDWKSINKSLGAVENRGVVISYEPTASHIHEQVLPRFQEAEAEVYQFIGQNLHLIKEPSFRLYLNTAKARAAGVDWRSAFLRSLNLTPQEVIVVTLKADLSYQKEEDRVTAFIDATGMHRATYYRIARKLETMRLGDTKPPDDDDDLEQYQPEEIPTP
jgi:hypothetical protein